MERELEPLPSPSKVSKRWSRLSLSEYSSSNCKIRRGVGEGGRGKASSGTGIWSSPQLVSSSPRSVPQACNACISHWLSREIYWLFVVHKILKQLAINARSFRLSGHYPKTLKEVQDHSTLESSDWFGRFCSRRLPAVGALRKFHLLGNGLKNKIQGFLHLKQAWEVST